MRIAVAVAVCGLCTCAPPRETTTLSALLVDPAALAGRVVDADGAPVAGAMVAAVPTADDDDRELHAVTDRDGRFAVTGAPADAWAVSVVAPAGSALLGTHVERAVGDRDLAVVLSRGLGVDVRGRVSMDALTTLPAGSFARLRAVGGDAEWLMPVASDGTFAGRLPRAGRYVVSLLAGDVVGYTYVPGDRDATDASLDAVRPAPPPADVVAWVSAHGAAIATADPARDDDRDLAPIAGIVGGARVVGLGEATHGSREFFQLKHRVLRYLVEHAGFRVFALEANEPECRAIDAYIHGGPGSVHALLDDIYFWTWDTEEVAAMIRWLRAWNLAHADRAADQVSFVGIDMQTVHVALQDVLDYVRDAGDDAAVARAGELARVLRPALDPEQEAQALAGSAAATAAIVDGVAALARELDAHVRSDDAYAVARHDLVVVQQWLDGQRAFDAGKRIALRDVDMAANLEWELARRPAGTRAVVWAHNEHVDRYHREVMGHELATTLGRDYVSIGFVFDRGSFQAVGDSGDVAEYAVGPAPDHDVAAAFRGARAPILAVDLRGAPSYFRGAQLTREIGCCFAGESQMEGAASLGRNYDAVIYVASTTRARPLE
jgi:erythromycin esterase|nr:erythromycin esterase family protein [Kofleriaceae bacterium]